MKKKDMKVVNEAIKKISSLNKNSTKDMVLEARLFYDSLSDYQKDFVTNLEDLKKYEELYIDPIDKLNKKCAYVIDLQIKSSYETIMLNKYNVDILEDSINLCEKLIYNNKYINNLELLNISKDELKKIKRVNELKEIAIMYDEKILELDKSNFESVLNLYNQIDEEISTYMLNYDKLKEYVYNINCIKEANKYDLLINNYKVVKATDLNSLLEIEQNINNLNKDVKIHIKNIDLLESLIILANNLIKEEKHKKLSNLVNNQLDLFDNILNDSTKFEEKKVSFEILEDLIKKLDNIELIDNLKYKELKNKYFKYVDEQNLYLKELEVINLIEKINSLDSNLIFEARNKYELLIKKDDVYNIDKLIYLEEDLYKLENALEVDNLIQEINDVSLSNKNTLIEIKKMYDELNDDEKRLVKNHDLLINYLIKIKELEKDYKLCKEIEEDINKEINIYDIKEKLSLVKNLDNIKNLNKLDELIKIDKLKNKAKLLDEEIKELDNNIEFINKSKELLNSFDDELIKYSKEYNNLLKIINIQEKRINDINLVIELINKNEDLNKIQALYNKLGNDKKYVSNYKLIMDKLRSYNEIKIVKKINYIDEQINLLYNLKDLIDITDMKNKLLEEINQIDDFEKSKLKNINKLKEL